MKLKEVIVLRVKTILIALLMVIFGAAFIIFGGTDVLNNTDGWETATAEIVEIVNKSKTQTVYVTYYTKDGKLIEHVKSNYYDSRYKVGDKVDIKYNPKNYDEISAVIPTSFKATFIVSGSVVITLGLLIPVRAVFGGIYAQHRVKKLNEEFALDFVPMFLLEYKPLDDTNQKKYTFEVDESDKKNYIVKDDKGEMQFFTQCVGKRIKYFTSIYQLADRFNKQTTIIKIRKPIVKDKYISNALGILVNNKSIERYFLERHITFECKKESDKYIYTMYYNSTKIADIFNTIKLNPKLIINGKPAETKTLHFDIITAKENIDDAALFVLCLTYR